MRCRRPIAPSASTRSIDRVGAARLGLAAMDSLVSTEWLAGELGASDLKVVDASAHLPAVGRDPRGEFAAGHIPGAQFLDLATLKDTSSPVFNALPNRAQFAERMAALGIRRGDRVVIYDDSDVKTSSRAWFILRMNGMRDVALLDGGIAKWKAEGRELETGDGSARPVDAQQMQADRRNVRSKA